MTCVDQIGKVIYRSEMSHGTHKRGFEVFDAGAFIAAVTQHIPPKGFQMVCPVDGGVPRAPGRGGSGSVSWLVFQPGAG